MRYNYLLYFLIVNLAAAFLKIFLPDAPALNTPLSKGETNRPKIARAITLKVPDNRTDTASIVIPLKRIGKLFLIEATVDGETGNLVFDTGASGLVLNSTYFRDHVSFGQNTPGGITGSIGTEDKVTVNKLDLGTIKYKKVSATLSNLGHIENRRGIKVLGLFGFELIRPYEIRIDYSNNTLTLFPMDKKGNLLNPSAAFAPDYLQKVDLLHNIMFLRAAVGGKTLRFCFDTGAETNVLSTDLPDGVLETVSITRTSKLRGGRPDDHRGILWDHEQLSVRRYCIPADGDNYHVSRSSERVVRNSSGWRCWLRFHIERNFLH